jgi:hypothetical protein
VSEQMDPIDQQAVDDVLREYLKLHHIADVAELRRVSRPLVEQLNQLDMTTVSMKIDMRRAELLLQRDLVAAGKDPTPKAWPMWVTVALMASASYGCFIYASSHSGPLTWLAWIGTVFMGLVAVRASFTTWKRFHA